MWRQNTFPEIPDSDQSISDEEDFNADLQDNRVSLGGQTKKEEGLQLQSRLDILRGTHEPNFGRKSSGLSPEKQTSISQEDEVEMPNFPDEAGFIFSPRKAICKSDEEVISDDEENNALLKFPITPGVKTFQKDEFFDFGNVKQDGENTWSAVNKETEALIHLNEVYSKANKSCKGVKSKSKPKFSFHFQSRKEALSLPSISKEEFGTPSKFHEVPERLETVDQREHSISSLLEDLHRKKANQSDIMPGEVDWHFCSEHSMAGLLDDLQDKTSPLRINPKTNSRTRGKKAQFVVKRSISPLGERITDGEDLPESNGSGSSSENEGNYQNLKLAVPEMKRQTIADRFQEALGATSRDEAALVAVPRSSGIGLFGKLQHVMQCEKCTDVDFLNSQTRASPNSELRCINVKISSKYLDAKLIVCRGSSGKDIEDPQWPESQQTTINGGRERTIIFNRRVCSDVDLEVGNSVRIHPPWKEVQVRENDESIILATYFTQISA